MQTVVHLLQFVLPALLGILLVMEFASFAMSLDVPFVIPLTTVKIAATTPFTLMQDQHVMYAIW